MPEEIKVSESNVVAKDISDIIKLETTLLENKYYRWIISIGAAFLVFTAIDTGTQVAYLKVQQESFDKSISILFESRDEVIKQLRLENDQLKSKSLDTEKLQFEIEKLKKINRRCFYHFYSYQLCQRIKLVILSVKGFIQTETGLHY